MQKDRTPTQHWLRGLGAGSREKRVRERGMSRGKAGFCRSSFQAGAPATEMLVMFENLQSLVP